MRERRRFPRFVVSRAFTLATLDEASREPVTSKDIGLGGACIRARTPIAPGALVILREVGGDFRTTASVRAVRVGDDGLLLNLWFHSEAPRRLWFD